MENIILETKLFAPTAGTDVIMRPRLISRLSKGVDLNKKLTLVSAPLGYGKTTLVSTWCKSVKRDLAWVSLDVEDNDPLQFWSYVIRSLQSIRSDLGQSQLSLLQTTQLSSLKNLLSELINQISHLPIDIVLALDDFHNIEAPEIMRGVQFFLDNKPSQIHVVIISREDPPLSLAEMRAKDQLNEFREKDLRFENEESSQFLATTMGLNLDDKQTAMLNDRAEGWIAALQMAAISMRDVSDKEKFVEDFAGDDRFVADYLISGVIERHPKHVQDFLLKTSILNRLYASLCNVVSNQTSGQKTLEYLEKTNGFLLSLDSKRKWYRYHHLFGELLHNRLISEVGKEETKYLHKQAAKWYSDNGYTDESVYHYLEALDYSAAAGLINSIIIKLIMQGQQRKALDWIIKLPKEEAEKHPLLCACHAFALIVSGHPDDVEGLLAKAENAIIDEPTNDNQEVWAVLSMSRAYVARNQGDLSRSTNLLIRAKEFSPEDQLILRSTLNLNLGYNHFLLGELNQADQVFRTASDEAKLSKAAYIALISMAYQGNVHLAKSDIGQAKSKYEEAIAYGLDQNHQLPFPPAGYAYVGLGHVLYEHNDIFGAEKMFSYAAKFGELIGDWSMATRGLLPLAQINQLLGDTDSAKAILTRAGEVAKQADGSSIIERLSVYQTLVNLMHVASSHARKANLKSAQEWAENYRNRNPKDEKYGEMFAQFVFVKVLLALDSIDEAILRTDELIRTAERQGWNDYAIKFLLEKSMACVKKGDETVASKTLNLALAKAGPGNYVRSFTDLGNPMKQLLSTVDEGTADSKYVKKLIKSFSQSFRIGEIDLTAEGVTLPYVDTLSGREITILKLMRAGLSNREIGEELFLSENTIKWYSSKIYLKLNVNSRTKAVARAKDLDLL